MIYKPLYTKKGLIPKFYIFLSLKCPHESGHFNSESTQLFQEISVSEYNSSTIKKVWNTDFVGIKLQTYTYYLF